MNFGKVDSPDFAIDKFDDVHGQNGNCHGNGKKSIGIKKITEVCPSNYVKKNG